MITFIEEDKLVGLMLCFEPSSQYVAVSAIAVGSVEAIAGALGGGEDGCGGAAFTGGT